MIKKKYNRLFLIIIGVLLFTTGITLILKNASNNIIFYLTPSEVLQDNLPFENKKIKLGGIVVPQSVKINPKDAEITFKLTDCNNDLLIVFNGTLPSLFREGQGIVAEGVYTNHTIYAKILLAKHDEFYKPQNIDDKNIKYCNKIIKYKNE